MDIKEIIVEYSKDIRIDKIGFAKAEEFNGLKEILLERNSKNYLSGFEEKNIEKRINPYNTLSTVKTIITIGISYNQDEENNHESPLYYGKISKSSLGMDYHIVLKEKLNQIITFINDRVDGFEYKAFVDTGPLVDRELAFLSGIGWYGKNNCIINTDYGSWIFIGYILCNLDIDHDESLSNKCMECNNCIRLCPTGALMDEFQYNAKRCISYLTQTKENIDFEIREKMSGYIYGCDICQLGCPYNKNIRLGNEEFKQINHGAKVDLLEILEMNKKKFMSKFGMSSLAWRGHTVIKRNALIALGNSKDPEIIDYIQKYINHDSPMIRSYTAWALIRIDKVLGKKIIQNQLKVEKNPKVIEEIHKLLKYYT